MDRQQEFDEWVVSVLPYETPYNVRAYNFNIAESMKSYVVEIIGAPSFDPENSDWACEEEWTSRPSQFELPRAAIDGEWNAAEQLIVELVQRFLRGSSLEAQLLRDADAVTVGFVDGDLKQVWPEVPA